MSTFTPNQADTAALAAVYGPVYAHAYGAAMRQGWETDKAEARAQTFAHAAAITACRCFLTDAGRKGDAKGFAIQ